jgi:hypothetical protein
MSVHLKASSAGSVRLAAHRRSPETEVERRLRGPWIPPRAIGCKKRSRAGKGSGESRTETFSQRGPGAQASGPSSFPGGSRPAEAGAARRLAQGALPDSRQCPGIRRRAGTRAASSRARRSFRTVDVQGFAVLLRASISSRGERDRDATTTPRWPHRRPSTGLGRPGPCSRKLQRQRWRGLIHLLSSGPAVLPVLGPASLHAARLRSRP